LQFTQGTQLNNLPISLPYTTNLCTHSKNHSHPFIVRFFILVCSCHLQYALSVFLLPSCFTQGYRIVLLASIHVSFASPPSSPSSVCQGNSHPAPRMHMQSGSESYDLTYPLTHAITHPCRAKDNVNLQNPQLQKPKIRQICREQKLAAKVTKSLVLLLYTSLCIVYCLSLSFSCVSLNVIAASPRLISSRLSAIIESHE